MIAKLESRFVQVDKSAVDALTLVPSNMDLPLPDIRKYILTYFGNNLNGVDNFSQEIRLWKRFWTKYSSKHSML